MTRISIIILALLVLFAPLGAGEGAGTQSGLAYPVVDTGQDKCYDNRGPISEPAQSAAFYGQDAQFKGNAPSYRVNGDGTISDLVTGLMWVKARGSKVTWDDAMAGGPKCAVGGYKDWRMPTIKELYSLINFNGCLNRTAAASTPYIDTKYFEFKFGDESAGERGIDSQDWSATEYLGTTMGGNATVFGVNFADGRIKGYPKSRPGPGGGSANKLFARFVRGNTAYGRNDFKDNGDKTITDQATGLMWSQEDSGKGMDWEDALAYVQAKNKEKHLGYSDWRLPNAKELQSIADYTRAPDAKDPKQRGPAINPVFKTTKLESGEYPYFWTGTTHLDGPPDVSGTTAVYVAFGRALGYFSPGGPVGPGGPGRPEGPGGRPQPGNTRKVEAIDVHGAGAQRSDPKSGDPADFPQGRGPQGDDIRINNFVRLVRTAG